MMLWARAGLTILLFLAVTLSAHCQNSDSDFIHFKADSLHVTDDNKVAATGNVTATYREYTVTSGKAAADLDANTATFEDNVVLSTHGVQVHGESLTLNLKTRVWDLKSAKTTVTPEAMKGNAKGSVFLAGQELSGTETNQVEVRGGSLTTCNLPEPHYLLSAKEVDVYPERKLIARHATLIALGHKLFSFPVLSIPLNRLRSRSNLIPQVGQTQAEGAFVKTAYNYLATRNSNGLVKLDLMSRKGFGQGLEHTYALGTGAGSIAAYHLFDRTLGTDSLTGTLKHNQKFGSIVMDLASDYRANSYQYASNTTTSSTNLSLVRNVKNMNTEFRVRQSLTNGFGSFSTLSSVLSHRQKLFGANTLLTMDYGRFGNSSATADNQELNSRLEMSRQLQSYDWQFVLNKRFDLDGSDFLGDRGFASLERLPELTLQSDTSRLGKAFPLKIPAAMSLSVGRYSERPLGIQTERMMFDINTRPQQHNVARRLGLNYTFGFRQGFYGNEAAQYVLRANTTLTQKIGDKSGFALNYRYQKPEGASAFRFDFASRFNVLAARLDIRETEKLRLSLTSGYNFALPRLPWQDAALRLRYTPSKVLSTYVSTGYDLNRSQWRSLINQLQIRMPRGFNLDVGTRYDIERATLGTARAVLDTPFGGKTRIQAVAGYNGFSRSFDYRALQITRDLHCWEASVAFVDQADFFAERGVRFNLRIKAFPIFDQFGIGQRGQSLTDTSMGDVL